MKRNKKSGFRKGFRKMNNKRTDKYGHPTYVYAKVGKEYKYIGITHSPITKGVVNIRLEVNPNPKDKSAAYVRPKAEKADRSKFGKRLDGWKFADKDKDKIKMLTDDDKH